MAFDFEPSIILETAPQLLGGMKLTLIITLGGLLVGLLLGVVTGLANTSRSRFLRGIAILYIEAIRGTPLIVQVMFLYFGLPLALGMRIPPDVAGVIAIGVNSGAYIAEIVRGAIQSIDKGQTEAGRSTGAHAGPDHALHHLASGLPAHDSPADQPVHHFVEGYFPARRHRRGRTDPAGAGNHRRELPGL